MRRSCIVCGAEYTARLATARYCSGACRAKASTLRRRGVDLEARAGQIASVVPKDATQRPPSNLVAVLRRDLDAAGKTNTHQGQLALLLADRLEAAEAETGSSLAALSKELTRVAGAALAGAQPEPDMLDDLVADVIDMRERRRRNPRKGR